MAKPAKISDTKRLAALLDAWLSGKLFGDDPLDELKTNPSHSRHIDELMGNRWRPTQLEMLRTSIAAFEILRQKSGKGFEIVLLTLPIRKTRFHSDTVFIMASIVNLIDWEVPTPRRGSGEPPELFLYPRRERASVRDWEKTRCVVLQAALNLTTNPVRLLAFRLGKSTSRRAPATVTSDCLFLV